MESNGKEWKEMERKLKEMERGRKGGVIELSCSLAVVIMMVSCMSSKNYRSAKSFSGDNVSVRPEFRKYFDECRVDGSIVIYDVKKQSWIVSDTTGIKLETLPASSFKILNLLIALETGVIRDENEIIKYTGNVDTVKYGYRPETYHDMSVKEAFEVSAVWVFLNLAEKIGRDNYRKFLQRCNYGNYDLSQIDPDFWNFGKFAVSPLNQTIFIKDLYEEKLPFSKRNIEIVKRVMKTEETAEYTIYAKTGWTRENNINTGWWVGYVENRNGTWCFATRLLQDRKFNRSDFGMCRKNITKNILRELKVID